MSFTKPNDPAAGVNPATYAAQAQPDKVDWDIIAAGAAGTGVVGSGCAVTPNSSGVNLNVNVAAGTIAVAGVQAAVAAATNVTVGAANATNPRIDLVVSSSSGVISVTAGTAAAVPCMPNVPASSVALAEVYVPAAATSITANNIRDCRVPIATSAGVLAVIEYANGTDTATYTTTSAALVDVDVTNAAVTLPAAPQSGKVLIRASCSFAGTASGGANGFLGIREGTTTLVQRLMSLNNIAYCGYVEHLVTGLTPGSAHTYKLAWATSAGTATIYTGPTYGPIVMSVTSV